jgi:hypothetical protein
LHKKHGKEWPTLGITRLWVSWIQFGGINLGEMGFLGTVLGFNIACVSLGTCFVKSMRSWKPGFLESCKAGTGELGWGG